MACYNWLGFSTVLPKNAKDRFLRHEFNWRSKSQKQGAWVVWITTIWSIWNLRNNIIFRHGNLDVAKHVGVTGFCLGGALSIASANLVSNLDAAVAFYGFPSSGREDPTIPYSPLQTHFGELENFVGFSDVKIAKKFKEELKLEDLNEPIASYEVHIYPGVGHAFMNRSSERIKKRNNMELPDEDEVAVQLSWSRLEIWMTEYLAS
ncbi:uncharacterized protein LOC130744951 [Lotus japonicus]|uniref:uncharacterized protein LOC130744951 n=1 Tax=Lotus japonicus TaxID=34305 RepID=UPI002582B38A|nr:uncharacterized protein LOC130744951 [Lotus japonicus]